ncbi:unnamed protein product [Ophioblennius macclurei]
MKVPGSTSARIRVSVFKIDEEKGEIVVDKTVTEPDLKDKDPFDFMKSWLEPLTCCFLLYDCHYTKEGSDKEDLVYILWCDEEAKMKCKMTYAASDGSMKKVMAGVKHNFQVNCFADISCRKEFAKMLGVGVTAVEGVSV